MESHLRLIQPTGPTPAQVAHERLTQAASSAYDQGFAAGERAGRIGRDLAFDCGVGVGAICGFAIGVVLTVYLLLIVSRVLS